MQTFQLRSRLFKAYMFLDRAVGKDREIESLSWKCIPTYNCKLSNFELYNYSIFQLPSKLHVCPSSFRVGSSDSRLSAFSDISNCTFQLNVYLFKLWFRRRGRRSIGAVLPKYARLFTAACMLFCFLMYREAKSRNFEEYNGL